MENNKVKNKCIYLQNREGKRFRHKKKTLRISSEGLTKLAATYFPTWYSSIIGTNGLNFSVRYGKRWIPIVITTIIFCSVCIQHIHSVFYINERETLRCWFPNLTSYKYIEDLLRVKLSGY